MSSPLAAVVDVRASHLKVGHREALRSYRYANWVVVAFFTVVMVLAIGSDSEDPFWLGPPLVLLAWHPAVIAWSATRRWLRLSGDGRSVLVEFTTSDDGLSISQPGRSWTHSWSEVRSWAEIDRVILLYLRDKSWVAVPVPTEHVDGELVADLRQRLAHLPVGLWRKQSRRTLIVSVVIALTALGALLGPALWTRSTGEPIPTLDLSQALSRP